MVFCVHVDGDVVNGMAAYQPVLLVCILCGGRMKGKKKVVRYRSDEDGHLEAPGLVDGNIRD